MTHVRTTAGTVVVCRQCGSTESDVKDQDPAQNKDLYEALLVRSEALWRAIRSLEDRAASSRWARRNQDSSIHRFGDSLEDSISRDEEMAQHLRRYVATVDETLRILHAE